MLQPEDTGKCLHETVSQTRNPASQPPCGRTMLRERAAALRRSADRLDALSRAMPVEITSEANIGLVELVMASEL